MQRGIFVNLNFLLDRHNKAIICGKVQTYYQLRVRTVETTTKLVAVEQLVFLAFAKLINIVQVYTKYTSKRSTIIARIVNLATSYFVNFVKLSTAFSTLF